MFINIMSMVANIGISTALTRVLVAKTPFRNHIILHTCEAVGIFFTTMMIGDKVEEYSKEKMKEMASCLNIEIINPEEVKDDGPKPEEPEMEDSDISEEFDKEEQDG